jgi:hypothetical protein
MGAVMAGALASAGAATPLLAAGQATLRIDPAVVRIVAGDDVPVRIVQDTPFATSGTQASLDFDPRLLQIESVTPGAAFAQAPVFVPRDLAGDIAKANDSGRLAQVAAAFTPPGAVPAGTATFLVVRFRAIACGTSGLDLPVGGPFDAQMIDGRQDGYGNAVPVTTNGGSLTTCVAPGDVTAITDDPAPVAATQGGAPVGLLAAAVVVVVVAVAVGGLAWRARSGREDA